VVRQSEDGGWWAAICGVWLVSGSLMSVGGVRESQEWCGVVCGNLRSVVLSLSRSLSISLSLAGSAGSGRLRAG